MANDIVKAGTTGLNKIEFDKDTIALIKAQIAPDATDNELNLFLYQCQRTGLDPLTRQIYCIHRKSGNKNKMTVQTSIDGFRVIAERSGEYGGQDKPVFGEPVAFRYPIYEWQGGQKTIKEWKEKKVPSFAEVTVYKFKGQQRYQVAVGVAYWEEYYPGHGQGDMWLKMPHTMLAKVAEALALRKAFPHDLSGLYTSDEMSQSETTEEGTIVDVTTSGNNGQSVQPSSITPAPKKKKEEKPSSEWYKRVEDCQTKKDLVDLYNKYREDIDTNPLLQQLIAHRRDVINDAAPAPVQKAEEAAPEKSAEAPAAEPKKEEKKTEQKPAEKKGLSAKAFKDALLRIEKGEGSVVEKLRETFILTEEQEAAIDRIIKEPLPF